MYEYLTGQVTVIKPEYLVLELGGVGYRLLVGNPFKYQLQQTATIYVQQVIRESEQVLYGFVDEAEKSLFERLTSVSGIGPKSAMAILAADDHSGLLNAIANEDVKFLTKFPGVGKKTAQQIILDLKDKIKITPEMTTDLNQDLFAPTNDQTLQDGLAALQALGYSARELQRIEPKLALLNAKTPDVYVREGLRLLSK
ncbi:MULTISPECIES: Holliday junction branch migration protein RuvA [Lapidilactobacillus]|uniref:Holliday junction branch migration complex subunit RuvA n=1 Tax=Lapidilactobacillus achengensis TaxID=2486000 RepID=A0ABW1UMW0_9LACO|nr:MULTISPECIES: Holliday junction branch migration protein RuvA [Lapidilactobacillus]